MSDTNVNVAACPEAAAVELVKIIAEAERPDRIKDQLDAPRQYYLDLYRECLAASRPPA